MMFLAGAAASAALDLISSLRQTADSGKSKTGRSDAVFGMATAAQPSVAETGNQKAPSQPVTSGTMRLMLSLQAHGVDMSSKIFDALDADGSGGVSKSEFEQIFAKNGDTQNVDTAFEKLDTDHDGTVNTNELASGLKTERRRHDGDGLATKTVANADGSAMTTISYGDGSSVTTRPAAASSATDKFIGNYLERLIQRQAEMLTPTTTGQSMAVSA
ncbi:EF-hand domain-containing protein [Xanthobacteraceae bacterium Astr-EGSB]|uniref:EF-hand domain-containing protein n=1 Tax=Astrobacterium formosum TaxID=3069710 RepID=UPI0027AF7F32|nr:EF-hand domain-containing protein [Xanthobacteraceae bacterium Astr-EGSB]